MYSTYAFPIYQENLEDEDTYIYLQSINGLVACANHNPELVVDLLTREFGCFDDRGYHKDKAVEVRTKLGEALVRVTKMLGELTPAFRDRLINPFLGQLNHPDHLVRASCLSNLGEVCKNLRFALGGILQEVNLQFHSYPLREPICLIQSPYRLQILLCLHQCLHGDRWIEVRRAAVLVLTLLLQGIGRDAFRLLRDSLRDIWR